MVRKLSFWNFQKIDNQGSLQKPVLCFFSLLSCKWVYIQVDNWQVSVVDSNTRSTMVMWSDHIPPKPWGPLLHFWYS